MNKPLSLKIICAYCLVRSAFLLTILALLLARPEEVGIVVSLVRHVAPVSFTKITILRLAFFAGVSAAVSLSLGIGLWYLREWARWGLLMLAGIPLARLGLALFLIAIFNTKVVGDAFTETVRLNDIANAIIIWFLVKPEFRELFKPSRTHVDANSGSW